MEYGICYLSIVPMRAEPSEKSEMVSQLIFGELYEIVEKNETWLHIRSLYDDYFGWISARMHQNVHADDLEFYQPSRAATALSLLSLAENTARGPGVLVPAGASLPSFKEGVFYVGTNSYRYSGHSSLGSKASREDAVNHALLFLQTAYLWGGRTAMGIDCSGFTQIVMKMCGIAIPRDASLQAMKGSLVNFTEEALPGDLAFFENQDGKIVHTGVMMDQKRIIHASGFVRIDNIDHHGIFSGATASYSHTLRLIRRYF
jgi:gamma-D-glutamyl-L-lysine dipeptidyl-peptidase